MSRIPVCMCKGCNSIGTVKIDVAKRGGGHGYMCDFHANEEMSYYDKNNYRRGNRKVNGFTYSMEFETYDATEKGRGELLDFGFIPTHDGSIGGAEYKSPIYEGLNAISKQLVSIDNLMQNNDICIDNHCGTHFHVGHVEKINPQTMNYIRRFYHSLFIPLCEVMKANPEKVERMFGRGFTYYASTIDHNTDATNHCNFINLQHDYTIEFRLCKFKNAKQYMNVVKFARDVVNTVIENFVDHFNREDFDRTRYASVTEYRKHKAQVTANKIVKLFDKYAN